MPLDQDGYPSDADLDKIALWSDGWPELMAFVKTCWNYADDGWWGEDPAIADVQGRVSGTRYRLPTAGWSGNESVVAALRRNTLFHAMCWWSSHRGGLHVYVVAEEAERA